MMNVPSAVPVERAASRNKRCQREALSVASAVHMKASGFGATPATGGRPWETTKEDTGRESSARVAVAALAEPRSAVVLESARTKSDSG